MSRILDEIRRLDIPAKCKADLAMLCAKAKGLGMRILRFVLSHRQFAEAMLLGAVAAYLLNKLPLVGGFLALCALVTAAAIGLMRELREDLARLFDCDAAQSA